MQPEELTSRPELKKVKLRLDLECSGIDDFDEWMAGLQKRGLI
jgi:hypothetical protein